MAVESESYPSPPLMIRRFFCLLLVSLMLANQGLCFAHTHHGTGVAEPEGHASQSHFHFGGFGQHESTHDQNHQADQFDDDHFSRDHRSGDDGPAALSEVTPIDNHDATAVYGANTVAVARDGNSVIVLLANYVAVVAIPRVTDQSDDSLLRLSSLRGQSLSVFDTACPILLRTLSLRI